MIIELPPGKEKKSIVPLLFGALLLIMLAVVLVYSYRTDIRLEDVLGNMIRKSEIISQMKTDLLRSAEAEKNAVMADTDEESRKFAGESMDASAAVDKELARLRELIEYGRSGNELKLLGEFDKCWSEFRRIDKELLDFAVLNTNLKATALSFGKGKEAISRFEQSLASLVDQESNTPEGVRAAKLAYAALSAGLGIHALEGPHIMEPRNERMDEIEAKMNEAAAKAKAALGSLGGIVKEEGRAHLSEAERAFEDFLKIHEEVIRLSRQNTNVRSMELSLGVKRKITAQCRDALSALQDAVKSRSFRATR